MNINDLRLTDDERSEVILSVAEEITDDTSPGQAQLVCYRAINDAQLAKTLRVLADWLHTTEATNESPFTSRNAFRDAMLALLAAAEAKTPVEAI